MLNLAKTFELDFLHRIYGDKCPVCRHKWLEHKIKTIKDGFDALCPQKKQKRKRRKRRGAKCKTV